MRGLVLLLLACLLPGAAAEGALYMTAEQTSGASTGTVSYTMVADAPTGEEAEKAYTATGFGAVTYTTRFDHQVAETMELGVLEGRAFLSCDRPTVYRPGVEGQLTTMRYILLLDGTEVARHDFLETRTCDGPTDIWEAIGELDASGTVAAAGSTLSMDVLVWWATGSGGTGDNGHVLVGSTLYPSGLTGPGLPASEDGVAAPELVTSYLEGDEPFVAHSWASPHNTTHAFTWNATRDTSRVTVTGNVSAGNVSVRLLDGDDTVLAEGSFDPDGPPAIDEEVTGPAPWRLELAYEGYVGDLRADLREPAGSEDNGAEGSGKDTGGDGPSGSPTPDGTAGGNGTAGNGTRGQDEGEDTSGPGLAVLLATMALAMRRRR